MTTHAPILNERAFSRTEILAATAVTALLLVVVLPALAHNRARASRIACANNLRQVGMGFQLWGNDHGDRAPYEVELADGGTRRHVLAVNTWLHFAWLSNELASARILLCPADTGAPASDFTTDPAGGYLNPGFRNRATSYAPTYRFGEPAIGVQIADRNIQFNTGAAGCSVFNTALAVGLPYSGATAGWVSGLHEFEGNYLAFDGAVEQADSAALRDAFNARRRDDGTSSLHFSVPR